MKKWKRRRRESRILTPLPPHHSHVSSSSLVRETAAKGEGEERQAMDGWIGGKKQAMEKAAGKLGGEALRSLFGNGIGFGKKGRARGEEEDLCES